MTSRFISKSVLFCVVLTVGPLTATTATASATTKSELAPPPPLSHATDDTSPTHRARRVTSTTDDITISASTSTVTSQPNNVSGTNYKQLIRAIDLGILCFS